MNAILRNAFLTAVLLPTQLPGFPSASLPMHFSSQQAQTVPNTLGYSIPDGWVMDEEYAKRNNLVAAFVPKGTTVAGGGDRVITISYDKKDPNAEGLENLKSYFAYDMRQTLAQAPNAKFARWQPSKLDPANIQYMSIEIYGAKRNQPAPQHLLIVDSGDGFYSITVTVLAREDLQSDIYDEFFNGLSLTPRS
jgi:hypothetical protein